MSFKFRRDGAVFPTEVTNGCLVIKLGSTDVSVPFPFLKRDFKYDNTEFPMSNIMVYLKYDEGTIIMRFDGTATIYNKDNTVIGFSKFDKESIYQHTAYIPHGIVSVVKDGKIKYQMKCTIYSAGYPDEMFLESVIDSEPIMFKPSENPEFCKAIANGNRYSPRLVQVASNCYEDQENGYSIIGTPLRTTGYAKI